MVAKKSWTTSNPSSSGDAAASTSSSSCRRHISTKSWRRLWCRRYKFKSISLMMKTSPPLAPLPSPTLPSGLVAAKQNLSFQHLQPRFLRDARGYLVLPRRSRHFLVLRQSKQWDLQAPCYMDSTLHHLWMLKPLVLRHMMPLSFLITTRNGCINSILD